MEKLNLAARVYDELMKEEQEKRDLQFSRILKNHTKSIIEQLFDPENGIIMKMIRDEGELYIPRFGKFRLHTRPPRKGRDPRTGQSVELATKQTIKFKASLIVESRLNE